MTSIPPLAHDLTGLADLSRRLGRNKAYVQGGGGNTSLKLDDGTMWVKASGVPLGEVTPGRGFVRLQVAPIRAELAAAQNEAEYSALIARAACEKTPNAPRASIESGFHAQLGTVVLHSHSVWANLVGCAAQGDQLLHRILPEARWIPYATPGLPVTHAMADHLPTSGGTHYLLLQNHGVIVTADTVAEAWDAHETFNAAIRDHFGLADAYPGTPAPVDADAAHLLFPDQAVYLSRADLRESTAGRETLESYGFLRRMLETLGLAPHYLPEAEAATLLAMEAEKYRQKVAGA